MIILLKFNLCLQLPLAFEFISVPLELQGQTCLSSVGYWWKKANAFLIPVHKEFYKNIKT